MKRKSLLAAWTRGNPRNYYLHYSHDNAANSCPIDETEWAPLPIEFGCAHTYRAKSRASQGILLGDVERRKDGMGVGGKHSYK